MDFSNDLRKVLHYMYPIKRLKDNTGDLYEYHITDSDIDAIIDGNDFDDFCDFNTALDWCYEQIDKIVLSNGKKIN